MNPSYIQFHHFFTKKSYCQLQKYFLSFDDNSYTEEIKEPLDNPLITYKSFDVFSGTENYKNLKFDEDFVHKEVFKLAEKQFLKFQKEIRDKAIYSDNALNNFTKKYISKKREYSEAVGLAEYLSVDIIAGLQLELDKLEEHVNDYLKDPNPNFKEKISFNWSNSSVLLFFHLLRKNNVIQWLEDRDIAKVIEYSFKYSIKDEYVPFTNSSKILGGFKRGERIPDASIKKIKEDILKPDFFKLEK